ncbi:MAG: polyprenyl synthetase family protein [Nitrospirae bacterium]|nr:polyprenyl synthetase family protein [Nitrospirota bacterium]MBI5696320.1 polyprenyl synthetase family protein [Nitrospirota bacterium]
MTITDVLECYKEDLARVEQEIQSGLASRAALVRQVGSYLLGGGGKRIRPLLLAISANVAGGIGPGAYQLGAAVEFIHTASLLHDDVVDGADIRRGRPAANNVFGNQATVLVGDYLYSKSLYQAVRMENQRVMDTLSDATKVMSEGEILQLLKIGDLDISESEYIEVIESKTAVLISAACRLGAILGGVPDDKEEALAGYGLDVGLAFQLLDDALDYTAEQDKLGKTLGKDLAEGKLTLPLIHLLKNATDGESAHVRRIIAEEAGGLPVNLEFVLGLMSKYRSIEYATDRALSYIEKAKGRLAVFPASPHKDALYAVADYVCEREM